MSLEGSVFSPDSMFIPIACNKQSVAECVIYNKGTYTDITYVIGRRSFPMYYDKYFVLIQYDMIILF